MAFGNCGALGSQDMKARIPSVSAVCVVDRVDGLFWTPLVLPLKIISCFFSGLCQKGVSSGGSVELVNNTPLKAPVTPTFMNIPHPNRSFGIQGTSGL